MKLSVKQLSALNLPEWPHLRRWKLRGCYTWKNSRLEQIFRNF